MQIQVSGHQLAAGDAFREYATSELEAVREKYFKRALSANVTLHPGPHGAGFACDAVLHVRGNVILKASGQGARAQPAFDVALAKIDKQLRRHVRRLHDHDGLGGEERVAMDANYTVFAQLQSEPEPEVESASAALVIAEAAVDVPRASVADAVTMLDLRNTTALLFVNSATDTHNMVYRREDGNIGWVEPGKRKDG
jgi:ribosomal subunit interface protein